MDKPPETVRENPPAYSDLAPPPFTLYSDQPPPAYSISEPSQQCSDSSVTAQFLPPTGQPSPAYTANAVYFIPPPSLHQSNQQLQQQQVVDSV